MRGTVKLDGNPVAGASVHFIPMGSGGKDATGTTDSSGVFRLTTFEPGDGALRGKYKVVIQPPPMSYEGPPAATPDEAQQADPSKLKAKSTPIMIPPRYSRPDQTELVQEVPPKGEIVFDLKSRD